MARDLLIAGRPTNLRLPEGHTATSIDSDLYNICERLKEISPRLSVIVYNPPMPMYGGGKANFAIMQLCEDGVDRLFFKCEYLDQRVLQKAAEYVGIPLAERIEAIEKADRKIEQEKMEDALDNLYEQMGGQMWHDLERCGFAQRPVSYRPLNKTALRAGRKV